MWPQLLLLLLLLLLLSCRCHKCVDSVAVTPLSSLLVARLWQKIVFFPAPFTQRHCWHSHLPANNLSLVSLPSPPAHIQAIESKWKAEIFCSANWRNWWRRSPFNWSSHLQTKPAQLSQEMRSLFAGRVSHDLFFALFSREIMRKQNWSQEVRLFPEPITVSGWFLNKVMAEDQLRCLIKLPSLFDILQKYSEHMLSPKSSPTSELLQCLHFTSFKLASQAQFHFMDKGRNRKCILQFHRLWSYCRTDFSLCFRVLLTFTNDCHQCHTVSPTINLSAGRGSEVLPRQLVSNRNWPASLHRTVPPVTNGNRCVKPKINSSRKNSSKKQTWYLSLFADDVNNCQATNLCHYCPVTKVRLLVQQFWYLEAIQ